LRRRRREAAGPGVDTDGAATIDANAGSAVPLPACGVEGRVGGIEVEDREDVRKASAITDARPLSTGARPDWRAGKAGLQSVTGLWMSMSGNGLPQAISPVIAGMAIEETPWVKKISAGRGEMQ
jgi:hypothetical protein